MIKKGETASQTKLNVDEMDKASLGVIIDAMHEKKAQGVMELNMSELHNAICDYFVIANASSTTQVSAIADNVEDKLIETFRRKVIRRDGDENALWIILDYGSIMVHVFQTECRDFYRLEDLWADAKLIEHAD